MIVELTLYTESYWILITVKLQLTLVQLAWVHAQKCWTGARQTLMQETCLT